jgi:acid phosphatase type 7
VNRHPSPRLQLHSFIAILSLAAAHCIGLGQGHSVTPQPAPDPNPTFVFRQFNAGDPIHLVAYGDMRFTDPSVTSGTNPRVRKWLAERIGTVAPQALLLTGDMPFTGADPADWQEFQTETASWRSAHILELPTTGNHEVKGGIEPGIANYLKNFPEIEGHRYYSALLGRVEVISLDMNLPKEISDPQARWFAAQLDHLPKQVEFLMILYHLPWMADAQTRLLIELPSHPALVLRGILEARMSHLHAKVIVFNGHIHNYERFERNGVEYVVTGGGGAQPYPLLLRGRADLYRDTGFPVYHYLTIDIVENKLHAVMWKVKDPDAVPLRVEAKDEFSLTAPIPMRQSAVAKRR